MPKEPRKHRRFYCANPVCRQPLDCAAPISPKKDTPERLIHDISLIGDSQERQFMCYECGHYTLVHPLKISMESRDTFVDLVAEAHIVNGAVLHALLDYIEHVQLRRRGHYLRLLIEIIAPQMVVTPTQALSVFHRAMKMGLNGSQVAYVITGRPWSITASLMQRMARSRGIHLGFFLDRDSASSWLNASDEAVDTG